MAYDATGNLYVADGRRNQVVEVTVGGELAVIVGTGEQGFAGDGGDAKKALLSEPEGLALGTDGTLYIADTGNRRIRAVARGTITTVAGTGTRGDAGDGGVASSASFEKPTAIAVTATGALLVCDTGNHRVRQVMDGRIVAFAGTGTQGFGGDGSAATTALLDSPRGIAVTLDGRVVIADSRNHRLRGVSADGKIQTIAGTGIRGFSGDNGPATVAQLFLPQGVTATATGTILFADSDNQRIRQIDANGIIITLAGNGEQGTVQDADASGSSTLNVPRAVAVSPYNAAALGDASAQSLKAVAMDGRVYLVPAPAARTSTVAFTPGSSMVYGQFAGTATVTAAVQPQGEMDLYESGSTITTTMLAGKPVVFALPTLAAGTHTLSAHYAGDGVNPEATSPSVSVTVQPASATATADPATVAYGAPIPTLTGTLTGILPQDASAVSVAFSTSVTLPANVSTYPIMAVLTGSASQNYALSNGGNAGTLTIRQATSRTTLQAASQLNYVGLPITLAANVLPEAGGSPTGEVDFLDGGTIVAKGNLLNGAASAIYLSPTAGSHSITANYLGGTNFAASSSTVQALTVSSMPDFTITTSATDQSIQSGLIATYPLTVAPKDGAFSSSVTFSVTGLPAGAVANFTPAAVVPGASGANTVLSIQTPVQRAQVSGSRVSLARLLVFASVSLFGMRRRKSLVTMCCLALLLLATGCGARIAGTATTVSPQTYPLVITGTSTNLAGSIVTHTLAVTLTTR